MALLVSKPPPCIIHEDDHLLVVNKPTGINTHSPSPFAGEGIYEWLKNREMRWAELSIIHRLDKITSGLMVFSKTRQASRSLTDQFTNRAVQKEYYFLTANRTSKKEFAVQTSLVRTGDKYVAKETRPGAEEAVTKFEYVGSQMRFFLWRARPLTGKTHQIRVHAQSAAIPILGDELYGGDPFERVCLHAGQIGRASCRERV